MCKYQVPEMPPDSTDSVDTITSSASRAVTHYTDLRVSLRTLGTAYTHYIIYHRGYFPGWSSWLQSDYNMELDNYSYPCYDRGGTNQIICLNPCLAWRHLYSPGTILWTSETLTKINLWLSSVRRHSLHFCHSNECHARQTFLGWSPQGNMVFLSCEN